MSQLPRRRLGGTDLDITPLGLGTWAIGGPWAFGWGPQDDAASVEAIHRAVALGINWLDTAAVYGLGHSEVIVGKAVAALPVAERPFIFAKCGLVWDEKDRMGDRSMNACCGSSSLFCPSTERHRPPHLSSTAEAPKADFHCL